MAAAKFWKPLSDPIQIAIIIIIKFWVLFPTHFDVNVSIFYNFVKNASMDLKFGDNI